MNYNKRKKMKIESVEEGTNECTHYERKEEKREEGKKEREERIPRGRKRRGAWESASANYSSPFLHN